MKFNFFLAILILILFYLLYPFFTTIFSSLLLAYMTFPIFKKINKIVKNKEFSAFISTVLSISFFSTIYYSFVKLINFIISSINIFFLNIDFSKLLQLDSNTDLNPILFSINILSLPIKQILEILFLPFLLFYFLLEAENIYKKIEKKIKKNEIKKLLILDEKMKFILKSIIKYSLKAIIIGIIAYLTFSILEMQQAFELSVLIGASSLLPIFNVGIIIFFLSAYYFIQKNFLISIILLMQTIFFTLIHYNFDIIFRLKKGINPLIFFSGIIMGIFSLGIFGFIAGPILGGFIQALYETISEK